MKELKELQDGVKKVSSEDETKPAVIRARASCKRAGEMLFSLVGLMNSISAV